MALIPAAVQRIAALVIGLSGALSATAEPITFSFEFNGSAFNNTAKAIGSITFDKALLVNMPTDGLNIRYHLNDPEVLALDMTVTGASSGNGHFGKSDFGFVVWQTNGVLDFTRPLLGQPTQNFPWGTTHDRYSGDFNFFAQLNGPDGRGPFKLGAAGGVGDAMSLVSMIPVLSAGSPMGSMVPEPESYLLMLGGLSVAGLTLAGRRQRHA